MAELKTINESGELTRINLGGTDDGDKLLTSDEIDAKILTDAVPYTGATTNVDLGDNSLLLNEIHSVGESTTAFFNVDNIDSEEGLQFNVNTGSDNIYEHLGFLKIEADEGSILNHSNYTAVGNVSGGGNAAKIEINGIANSILVTTDKFNIGDVAAGDYAAISAIGELRLYGEATQWTDLRVSANSTKKGGSKEPTFTKILDNGASSQGVFAEAFSASTEEELYFEVQMPHGWKVGSDIEAHVHWLPNVAATVTDKVSWGLEYTWSNVGDTFGNTTIISGDTIAHGSTAVANSHCITELGDIDATGKTLSSMLMCRVFRDATGSLGTDDYASLASLLEIDFHYQIDALGSKSEYVKY